MVSEYKRMVEVEMQGSGDVGGVGGWMVVVEYGLLVENVLYVGKWITKDDG